MILKVNQNAMLNMFHSGHNSYTQANVIYWIKENFQSMQVLKIGIY